MSGKKPKARSDGDDRWAETMLRRGIPPRFREATIDTLTPPFDGIVSDFVLRWKAGERRKGLLLCGPPGVGKTWAISALVRRILTMPIGLRVDFEFVTAPDLFQNLQGGTFAEVRDRYRDCTWEKTYSDVPLLVINDLGKEYRGGRMGEQVAYFLGRVMRHRSERNLPTFVTTNLSGVAITETYGDSISSLMSEMMVPHVVRGPDRRGA